MKKERDGGKCRLVLIVSLCLLPVGCAGRDPDAQRRTAVAATLSKLQACAPGDEAEGDVRLAIASVTRQANETNVRLAAYALDMPDEVDLPTYSLSRGRWLIRETGRTYILDEQCREYKLKERKSVAGRESPPDGRISLAAGQVIEATLSFPALPEDVRMGVLVYGRRALPFLLRP
ncbi:MAG: hypothetical protein ABIP14_15280 [Blastocatellia bacterium]